MTPSEKRLPGQTNADYGRGKDPNAEFLGTQSLDGGGDDSFVYRGILAFISWRDRSRRRRIRP